MYHDPHFYQYGILKDRLDGRKALCIPFVLSFEEQLYKSLFYDMLCCISIDTYFRNIYIYIYDKDKNTQNKHILLHVECKSVFIIIIFASFTPSIFIFLKL
jgi:hypothetical protein